MKAFFAKVTLAALAAFAPLALNAQTDSIVYGRATIILTPAVMQQFASLGVTISDLSQCPLRSSTNTLTALEGAIDLQTSFNEVVYAGGYQFTTKGATIRLQNLTLDLTGSSAVFSAVVIENGSFVGRQPIFSINLQGAPPSLPIVPENGTISHNGLSLSFEPAFVDLINRVAAHGALNTSAQIGTLNLYSVLVPVDKNETWHF